MASASTPAARASTASEIPAGPAPTTRRSTARMSAILPESAPANEAQGGVELRSRAGAPRSSIYLHGGSRQTLGAQTIHWSLENHIPSHKPTIIKDIDILRCHPIWSPPSLPNLPYRSVYADHLCENLVDGASGNGSGRPRCVRGG